MVPDSERKKSEGNIKGKDGRKIAKRNNNFMK